MRSASLEIIGLIVLGCTSRLIPHLPNMTAMNAVALKARARFGYVGVVIPIISMFLSDIALGFYNFKLLIAVYASFACVALLGRFLQSASIGRITAISTLGSLFFFFLTNTVVWAGSIWYPHTVRGLIACLIAGLPFLYPMIVGDVIFSQILFRFGYSPRTMVIRDTRHHATACG